MAFKKKRDPNETIKVYYRNRKLRDARSYPESEILLTAKAAKARREADAEAIENQRAAEEDLQRDQMEAALAAEESAGES